MAVQIDRRRHAATDHIAVGVEFMLTTGERTTGRLFVPPGQSLATHLNGPAAFVDFQPFDGGPRRMLAKTAIQHVAQIVAPDDKVLMSIEQRLTGVDPHAVLGVSVTADLDEIATAYRSQIKTYNTERYVGVDLPLEVRDYLWARALRIQTAYEILKGEHHAKSPIASRGVVIAADAAQAARSFSERRSR